jgi:PAS domain S-box-containing protein
LTATVENAVTGPHQTIAELQRQLDERTAQLDEALAQQTATAEMLGVINSSPGDLAPVFDAMLEKALGLCEATYGHLVTFDGEYIHIEALTGDPRLVNHFRNIGPVRPPPESVVERFLRGEDVVHIADTADDPGSRVGGSLLQALTELGGTRSLLGAALRKDRVLLGGIVVYRQEVRPFGDQQIALLQNFAAQAVIAMENARLITETREALEQQTATAEVLGVINSSPGDLAPVFDAMLEKAIRLCEAQFGFFLRYQGARYVFAAGRGLNPAFAEYMPRMDQPAPNEANARVAQGASFIHYADLRDDDAYRSGAPFRRAIVDVGGARTGMAVALRKDGQLLGTFSLFRYEVRSFSEKQIGLVQNFAAQAVIAMENARLITETREALEQQTATAEVLGVINSSPGDLAPVFDAMLEKAIRLCDAAEGVLWTINEGRGQVAAARGLPANFVAALNERGQSGTNPLLERVMRGEHLIHIPDTAQFELYGRDPLGKAAVDAGVRSLIWVALVKSGAAVGAFAIGRREVRPFSDKGIALLQNFAAQAVIAMENARLITETQDALEQQTATSEVLQVINSSPGDLTPVFEAMLEKALDLCSAAFGVLWTYDGEFTHAAAIRGATAEYREFLSAPHRPGPGSAQLRLIQGERFVHLADLADSDDYRSGDALPRALVDLGGGRSLLAVPLRKDGAYVGAIMIYRQQASPFSDKQIALLENFAAQAVIAMENARLLGEIQQRQAELRVTFDNMADGVVMFDEELRLAAWNRNFQDLLDLPDAVLAERPSYANYIRILAERGEFGTDDIDAELSRRLEDTEEELRLERTRPDGQVIEVRRNAVPDGGFVLIYSDITERKRAETEIRAARDAAERALQELQLAQASLVHAQKMAALGQLTAGIAHEIKNPLNFVNNFAGLSVELLDELKQSAAPAIATLDGDTRAEIDETVQMLTSNLEKIAEHGQRADGIVKSMLEHSRGVAGERREVDLNNLIDEALNLAYHGARAQDSSFNIGLEHDYAPMLKPIELVPQEITRVFLNLFGNGFYAAHKQAHQTADAAFQPLLTVATRDLGEVVEIRIRDNGTGIPHDVRDKLFQPFFTTKPTGEGTGLGLSISYDIVTQQHGGTIEVDSKVGEFTQFTIRLPRQ